MPIFEYRCRACGKITEQITRTSKQEILCPFCAETAERIISLFSSTTSNCDTHPGHGPPLSGG